jgi:hypothetical protein
MCREAYGECDLPEYCTGDGEFCPNDVFKRDTEECESGQAYCYQGSCRSHNYQCKVLWGPSGASSDQCYHKNTNGSRHGNCGYDRFMREYIPCKHEDAVCGMLQCRYSKNQQLEFGMEPVAILSHSYMNYRGSIVACRSAIIDLGLQSVDPGLTPDGAKCGEGKMCVMQKCLAIAALVKQGKVLDCPDCNGNGVCNSKGHCHCEDGWAPPFCKEPGFGGSSDSGPASNPDSKKVIIFLKRSAKIHSSSRRSILHQAHVHHFPRRHPMLLNLCHSHLVLSTDQLPNLAQVTKPVCIQIH